MPTQFLKSVFGLTSRSYFVQDQQINIKDIFCATFVSNVLQNDAFYMPVTVNWSKIVAFQNEKN